MSSCSSKIYWGWWMTSALKKSIVMWTGTWESLDQHVFIYRVGSAWDMDWVRDISAFGLCWGNSCGWTYCTTVDRFILCSPMTTGGTTVWMSSTVGYPPNKYRWVLPYAWANFLMPVQLTVIPTSMKHHHHGLRSLQYHVSIMMNIANHLDKCSKYSGWTPEHAHQTCDHVSV